MEERVVLRNLKNAPELNGRTGQVEGRVVSLIGERLLVRVDNRTLSVAPQNVREMNAIEDIGEAVDRSLKLPPGTATKALESCSVM